MTEVFAIVAERGLPNGCRCGRQRDFFSPPFVLEDVAAVGAGLLLATGQISWPLAFTFMFSLGIWLGDAGLYALARFGGRQMVSKRSSLRKFAAKVARSEKWFTQRGTPILIFKPVHSRRARLPTYPRRRIFCACRCRDFLFVTGCGGVRVDAGDFYGSRRPSARSSVRWLNAYKQKRD